MKDIEMTNKTLDFTVGATAELLRERLRKLIADNVPEDFPGAFTDDPADFDVAQAFCRLLADENLLTLAWPEEYGGSAGSVWEQAVVREEMWAHAEPRGAQYMGLNWVGPVIMQFGTSEQKVLHLPNIARGNGLWCQGFSEPDAGSDLGSLKTAATTNAEGDGWVINGQKVWTSYALMADWCFLAARVGNGPKKHDGITIFLVPMTRDGITVRPIKAMIGPHHLNECFFDGLKVGPADVLGEVGSGWEVMRAVLAHERVGIARYARCDRILSLVEQANQETWADLPASLQADWVRRLVQIRTSRLLAYRAVAAQDDHFEDPDLAASKSRIAVTQCDQDVAELMLNVLGSGALRDRASGGTGHGAVEDHWRYAQASTVASGTIQIQRLIVARHLFKD